MAKKRVFSGIKPSGDFTIGNYMGALSNWVKTQDEKENVFCIVDLHAITVPQDPKEIRRRSLEFAKIYLAAGLDPKKSAFFIQSDRPEHSELAWILNCFTYFGEASRMTQFKDQYREKKKNVTVGLFDYPVLMAADIILYDSDEVPVGEDQKQHVEITRDIAERMNRKYGKLFVVPDPMIKKEGARIMALGDPKKKMAKSDDNPNNSVYLRDNTNTIQKKFAKATTDSENKIKFDKEKKPGISNLLNIMSVATDTPIPDLEKKYASSNYGEFKKDVADSVIEMLKPIQAKLAEYDKNEDYVRKVLRDGAEAVAPRAQATLERVKKAVGLGL
ncbi:tryptophan--tRNA ligase [candidate division WS5 bacterium]|uniref:Tryptophan--tRNA ligase n=1 Tax=candidate division WS5 bacterium TaxID=2093353 RepID=A0A419DGT1_9BACT|nr:MAG: tryptophan--tRNA ligase [candidate division WS5 bacterium]